MPQPEHDAVSGGANELGPTTAQPATPLAEDRDAAHAAPGAAPTEQRAPLLWYRRPALQRRLRLIARLAEMSPAEVIHRLGRLAAKRRARRRPAEPAAPETMVEALLPMPMAASPTAYLTNRTAVAGFFPLDERPELAERARGQIGHHVERTVREAAAILTDGVELLGRRFTPAAPGFDWLADPDLGRMWPMVAMDDADAVRRVRADVKFVWEVNRHQFLVTLARAHAYSQREELASSCVAMVRRWIDANPPRIGVNWSSNLEIAIRSISWMWAIQLLVGAAALSDEDLKVWLASLRQHRDYLVDHLSVYTDPTNHLIGEAAALAMLSIWMPEWESSAAHRELALATLTDAVVYQVAEDGIDIEQATSYQRFVLDLVLQVIALADHNALAVPPALRERARAMLEAVAELIGPGPRAPRIGDSDDARGLPFFTEDAWDFGELLAAGAAVLGDTTGFSQGRPLSESAFWLGGGRTARPSAAANEPHRFGRAKLLSQGGYAILPSLADADGADRMIFDCGPLGYLPHCSHGHADLLSVIVNLDGQELLVDPGSFAYYDERGRRDLFRATRSHNTIEVGCRDQADAFDPFKWLNIPETGLASWHTGTDFHYVEAWHDGYRRVVPAARHRRAVVTLHGGWLLVDWLEGAGRQSFSRWFHAGPTTEVEPADPSTVLVRSAATSKALQVADILADTSTAATGITGAHLGTAPYSERYGRMCEAPAFRFADVATLPAVRMTLVAVHRQGADGLQVLRRAGSREAGGLWVELLDTRNRRIQIIARTAGAPRAAGELRTDGRAAVVALADAGAEHERFIASGTFLEHHHAD